jgi:dephospho-CoA kinase
VTPDNLRIERLHTRGEQFNVRSNGEHSSETELDQIVADYNIANSGDISLLENEIAALIGCSKIAP